MYSKNSGFGEPRRTAILVKPDQTRGQLTSELFLVGLVLIIMRLAMMMLGFMIFRIPVLDDLLARFVGMLSSLAG